MSILAIYTSVFNNKVEYWTVIPVLIVVER